MITQGILDSGAGVAIWLASLFPPLDLPGWFVNFGDTVNGFFDSFDGLGAWAPWGLLGVCVALSLGAWGIGAAIKLVRAVVSHVPFVGGAG